MDISSETDRLLRDGDRRKMENAAKDEGKGRYRDGDTRMMDYVDTSCLGPKNIHPRQGLWADRNERVMENRKIGRLICHSDISQAFALKGLCGEIEARRAGQGVALESEVRFRLMVDVEVIQNKDWIWFGGCGGDMFSPNIGARQ